MTDFIESNFIREVELLKALVRVPSDNPPGDCARHGEAAAKLFEGLGFKVDRHAVPAELVTSNAPLAITTRLLTVSVALPIEAEAASTVAPSSICSWLKELNGPTDSVP